MTGRTWNLHSTTLISRSAEFKDILAKAPTRRIGREDKLQGDLIKWKLQMVRHHAAHYIDPQILYYVDYMALVSTARLMNTMRTFVNVVNRNPQVINI